MESRVPSLMCDERKSAAGPRDALSRIPEFVGEAVIAEEFTRELLAVQRFFEAQMVWE